MGCFIGEEEARLRNRLLKWQYRPLLHHRCYPERQRPMDRIASYSAVFKVCTRKTAAVVGLKAARREVFTVTVATASQSCDRGRRGCCVAHATGGNSLAWLNWGREMGRHKGCGADEQGFREAMGLDRTVRSYTTMGDKGSEVKTTLQQDSYLRCMKSLKG